MLTKMILVPALCAILFPAPQGGSYEGEPDVEWSAVEVAQDLGSTLYRIRITGQEDYLIVATVPDANRPPNMPWQTTGHIKVMDRTAVPMQLLSPGYLLGVELLPTIEGLPVPTTIRIEIETRDNLNKMGHYFNLEFVKTS